MSNDASVAVVTGAARGIGLATTKLFLERGHAVALLDIDGDTLARAAVELNDAQRVLPLVCDVAAPGEVAVAFERIVARYGRIDALVNNAGILGEVLPLWNTDPANFRRVLEVNLVGAYLCMRAVLRVMRAQAPRPLRGHIVNIASIQGKEGMPLAGAYATSKAGLIGLTKTAGKEAGPLGIMVNCVTPAAAETAMAKEISDERRADIIGRIPLGRFVEVDEIARMVAFLCSDDCSFSTGAVFDLSGGRASY